MKGTSGKSGGKRKKRKREDRAKLRWTGPAARDSVPLANDEEEQTVEENIIGINIRRLLVERDMKQSELARKVNVSPQVMTQYISGTIMPKAFMIADLAKALECSSDEILFEPTLAPTHTTYDGKGGMADGEEARELDTKTRRGALMKLRHEIDDLLDDD